MRADAARPSCSGVLRHAGLELRGHAGVQQLPRLTLTLGECGEPVQRRP
jgi:hypothetical protein